MYLLVRVLLGTLQGFLGLLLGFFSLLLKLHRVLVGGQEKPVAFG